MPVSQACVSISINQRYKYHFKVMVEDLVNVKTCLTTRLGTISAGNNTFFSILLTEVTQAMYNLPTKASVHVSAREAYLHEC